MALQGTEDDRPSQTAPNEEPRGTFRERDRM